MKVVQLSTTVLAGLPYRMSEAVNRHTEHESRSITTHDGYGPRKFPTDVLWPREGPTDECLRILGEADTYVLHSYFGMRSNGWKLRDHVRSGDRVTSHICVRPETANKELINEGIPTSVSAQYHARFFPESRVMPNIMPIGEGRYLPVQRAWPPEVPLRVAFSPSNDLPAPVGMLPDRWNSKGSPETLAVLQALKKSHPGKFDFNFITDEPLERCMEIRSKCHVSIDEVVTGSYHNVFLESMSQGLLAVAYLDPETLEALGAVVGPEAVQEAPWANVRLPDLRQTLERLISSSGEVRSRADGCRRWIETHWDEKRLIESYVEFWASLPAYRSVVPG